MGQTFQQLGHLFLETIPTVVLVYLLFVILDRILFRPLTAVMKKRDEMTVGALARARDDAAAAATKTASMKPRFNPRDRKFTASAKRIGKTACAIATPLCAKHASRRKW